MKSLEKNNSCFGVSRKEGIDITNYQSFHSITFNPDIIIHAAASLSNNIEETFNTNILGTLNICKYAKEKKVKHLVLISSIFIFNNIENGYFNNYGQSKKQAEEIAESFCKENDISLTILRFSQIFDEKKEAAKSQGMLYYFIDTIKNNQTISIFGNKNPIRNYIHIKDVLKVIEEVVNSKKTGIFNVLNPKNHTINEIAYMIFDVLDIKPNIDYIKEKEDILSIYVPSEDLYPNKDFIDLKSGITEVLAYE